MEDTSKTRKRRERETRTVSQMIALYCAANHKDEPREARAVCGKPLCAACAELDAYCAKRTERCLKMHEKKDCNSCPIHCYAPAKREAIRAVMRFSGPRMLFAHPVAALRHLLGK